jgi:hypothetical protein
MSAGYRVPTANYLSHYNVFVLADQLEIKGLKDLVIQKLDDLLTLEWEFPKYVKLIYEVYSRIFLDGTKLRSLVSTHALEHHRELGEAESFQELVGRQDMFSFSRDVLFKFCSFANGVRDDPPFDEEEEQEGDTQRQ